MSNETPITVVGNLTADPELMFTPSGVALARFTVASTPRRFDKNSGEHADGETLFMRCTAWRESAEHVAESLNRGHRVVVTGRLRQSNWETPEGDKRSSIDLDVDEVGPSLRWATAKVTKTTRTGGQGGSGADANDPWRQPPADRDPWATPAPANGNANGERVTASAASSNGAGDPSWGSPADEPPF